METGGWGTRGNGCSAPAILFYLSFFFYFYFLFFGLCACYCVGPFVGPFCLPTGEPGLLLHSTPDYQQ